MNLIVIVKVIVECGGVHSAPRARFSSVIRRFGDSNWVHYGTRSWALGAAREVRC